MRFTPKTDEELNPLLMPGEYDAEVYQAEEKVSSKGNDMIEVRLKVYHDGGPPILLRDWLLDSVPAKLKRFCESAGLMDLYEAGELTAESCAGSEVRVQLKIKTDPQYGEQNAIGGYVAKRKLALNPPPPKPKPQGTGMSAAQMAAVNEQFPEDDSIPFLWLVPFFVSCSWMFV
jgi:hypothetical protein